MVVIPMLFTEVRERGQELLAEYAAECSIPALGDTNPQWDMYELLQRSGKLHVFGAYCDSRLVGFATVLIHVLPHYGVAAGIVESMFVASSYRTNGAGTALMRAVEACSDMAGCDWVAYQAKVGSQLERILDAKRAPRIASIFLQPIARNARGAGES